MHKLYNGFKSLMYTHQQRQLSVPSLRGRLMGTSESRGVNRHTTAYKSFVFVMCSFNWYSVEG